MTRQTEAESWQIQKNHFECNILDFSKLEWLFFSIFKRFQNKKLKLNLKGIIFNVLPQVCCCDVFLNFFKIISEVYSETI